MDVTHNAALLSLLAFLLLAGCTQHSEQSPWAGPNETIYINAANTTGGVSSALSPGIMSGLWESVNYPAQQELGMLGTRMVWRLHYSNMLVDYLNAKPQNESDWAAFELNVTKDCAEMKSKFPGKIILTVGTTLPLWLSSHPEANASIGDGAWFLGSTFTAPNDYSIYEDAMRRMAKANRECGLNADYIILDEPDWMFYGNESEAFATYAAAARGIRAGDPDAKIGALGVSGWEAKKASIPGFPADERPYNHTMLKAFVDYVSQNPDVPVDFIDWHFSSPYAAAMQANQTREWINSEWPEEKRNVSFTIGEGVYSPQSDYESTEKGSSYLIAEYISYSQSGISRFTATSLHDQYGWLSGTWQHVGFFSDATKKQEEIIKPKWNAMKLLGKLSGSALESSVNDSAMYVAASKNGTKVNALLSFHPKVLTFVDCLRSRGYNTANYSALGFTQGQMKFASQSISSGDAASFSISDYRRLFAAVGAKLGDARLPAELETAARACISENNASVAQSLSPRMLTFSFAGLEPGNYRVKIYVVDANHSNPYRFNQRTGEVDKNVDSALAGPIQARNAAVSGYLVPLGYTSAEVSGIIRAYDACEKQNWYDTSGKSLTCFRAEFESNYASLSRYKSGATLETMENEIAGAAKAGAKAYSSAFAAGDFYYRMESINEMQGVALEAAVDKPATVTGGAYNESVIALPYSVIYVELEKQ